MKLGDLLTMLEDTATIVVWHEDDSDEDPTYRGAAMNCPWWVSQCEIYGGLDCHKMMDVRLSDGAAILVVTVKDVY